MKTITEMTRELGGFAPTTKFLEAFAELVRADEREACAKVCESMRTYVDRHNAVIQSSATDCAAAIRARGNT
jgi:hypothetical protein